MDVFHFSTLITLQKVLQFSRRASTPSSTTKKRHILAVAVPPCSSIAMESLLQCSQIPDIHWDCNSMEHEILIGGPPKETEVNNPKTPKFYFCKTLSAHDNLLLFRNDDSPSPVTYNLHNQLMYFAYAQLYFLDRYTVYGIPF